MKLARVPMDSPERVHCVTAMSGESGMDFEIRKLNPGEVFSDPPGAERAYLLMGGKAEFDWESGTATGEQSDLFRAASPALHIGCERTVTVRALTECELAVMRTENAQPFDGVFYTTADVRDELRGLGTMRETSTRVVRTHFDDSNAPYANLVLGEVITHPGKWSSYPPHHHPQPEIYHYRMLPAETGFGLCMLGEEVVRVRHGDSVLIPPGAVHPQTAAPGYAMYYLWVIRHLPGDRYITPTFEPQHLWVTEPDARIYPDD